MHGLVQRAGAKVVGPLRAAPQAELEKRPNADADHNRDHGPSKRIGHKDVLAVDLCGLCCQAEHVAGDMNGHGRPDRRNKGTGKGLAWLIGKNITPHVPVRDLSKRKDGTSSRVDFIFDTANDIYACPAGKALETTGRVRSDNTCRYLASTFDCRACSLNHKCCPNMPFRRAPRDINEAARDIARSFVGTPEFERSSDELNKVEMRFAH